MKARCFGVQDIVENEDKSDTMTTEAPQQETPPSPSISTPLDTDAPPTDSENATPAPISIESLSSSQKMQLLLQMWYQRKYNQLNPLKENQKRIFNEEYTANQDTARLNAILDSYVKIKQQMNLSDQVNDLKIKMLNFRRDHQELVRELKFIHEELLPYMETRQQYASYNKWKNERRHEILDLREQKRQKQYAQEEQKIKAQQQHLVHDVKTLEKKLDSAKKERELKQKRADQLERERIEREQDIGHQLKRIQEEKERIKRQIQEEQERKLKVMQEMRRKEKEEQLKREAEERMKKEMEEMEELRKQLEALKKSNEELLEENTDAPAAEDATGDGHATAEEQSKQEP